MLSTVLAHNSSNKYYAPKQLKTHTKNKKTLTEKSEKEAEI
jgi:hypothetical protein